jgi:hypothetical protein
MKKLIGAIFILIALSGCDSKSSKEVNADPKYVGIDEIIEEIIETIKDDSSYDNQTAEIKIGGAKGKLMNAGENANMHLRMLSNNGVQNNCTKEEVTKSFGDYAGEPENKKKINLIMSFTPFLCENGVYNKNVDFYDINRKILEPYAMPRFKDEFLSK